jgi:hypothetical protein
LLGINYGIVKTLPSRTSPLVVQIGGTLGRYTVDELEKICWLDKVSNQIKFILQHIQLQVIVGTHHSVYKTKYMMQGVAWPSMTVFQQHPLKYKRFDVHSIQLFIFH